MIKRVVNAFTAAAAAVRSARSARLLALELAGAASVLTGIALWSVPSALVVGGVAAVLAAERQPGT